MLDNKFQLPCWHLKQIDYIHKNSGSIHNGWPVLGPFTLATEGSTMVSISDLIISSLFYTNFSDWTSLLCIPSQLSDSAWCSFVLGWQKSSLVYSSGSVLTHSILVVLRVYTCNNNDWGSFNLESSNWMMCDAAGVIATVLNGFAYMSLIQRLDSGMRVWRM